MNRSASSVSSLCLLAAFLVGLPVAALAQSAVPLSISYQGKVTNAAGVPIGEGTPVNRQVIFRVYDSPTSTIVIHAEKQVVTISEGEFSVLLGAGDAVPDLPKLSLDAAFLNSQRFLGVTVDNGNDNDATNDVEISPRQQIVATPFAFRARVAEALTDNAISTANMIANNAITGVKLAENTITSAKIQDLTITANDLADSSVTSAKIANGSVATVDLADGAVTTAKLDAGIGVWSVNGGNVHRNSNVGIGNTSNAIDRLTVSGGNIRMDNERYLAFTPNVDNFTHVGKSMPNHGIGSFVDSNLGTSPSLWLSGWQGQKFFTGGAPRMVITGGGWVGIGTTGPDDQLSVYSSDAEAAIRVQSGNTGFEPTDGVRLGTNGNNAFIHSYEPIEMTLSTGAAVPLRLYPDGRVGINGGNPDGDVNTRITATGAQGYMLAMVNRSGQGAYYFGEGGSATKLGGANTWSISSDARLKKDVHEFTGALEDLLRLRSVKFHYTQPHYGTGEQTGFIAQEVEKVFPKWVSDGPDGFKAVTVYGFESLTVQALRELRAEKDAQIATLTARAESAEARLAALEKQVAALAAAVSKR